MTAVDAWLRHPRELLQLVVQELCSQARAWRAGVLGAPPVAAANLLAAAGSDIRDILFFPGLAGNISELAAPGSSEEEFARDVLQPQVRATMTMRTYQLERNHAVCSQSAMFEQLVELLIRLERRERSTVQLALLVLYVANIIPSHWLPTDDAFCSRVQLYSSLRGSSICNLPALHHRFISALRQHGQASTDRQVHRESA